MKRKTLHCLLLIAKLDKRFTSNENLIIIAKYGLTCVHKNRTQKSSTTHFLYVKILNVQKAQIMRSTGSNTEVIRKMSNPMSIFVLWCYFLGPDDTLTTLIRRPRSMRLSPDVTTSARIGKHWSSARFESWPASDAGTTPLRSLAYYFRWATCGDASVELGTNQMNPYT